MQARQTYYFARIPIKDNTRGNHTHHTDVAHAIRIFWQGRYSPGFIMVLFAAFFLGNKSAFRWVRSEPIILKNGRNADCRIFVDGALRAAAYCLPATRNSVSIRSA